MSYFKRRQENADLEIAIAREVQRRRPRVGRSRRYEIARRWIRRFCRPSAPVASVKIDVSLADELRAMARRLIEIADELEGK